MNDAIKRNYPDGGIADNGNKAAGADASAGIGLCKGVGGRGKTPLSTIWSEEERIKNPPAEGRGIERRRGYTEKQTLRKDFPRGVSLTSPLSKLAFTTVESSSGCLKPPTGGGMIRDFIDKYVPVL